MRHVVALGVGREQKLREIQLNCNPPKEFLYLTEGGVLKLKKTINIWLFLNEMFMCLGPRGRDLL